MAARVAAASAYHATLQRNRVQSSQQQQRNRKTENTRRRSNEGGRDLALLDGPEGAEDGAFLEALKSCIEAKVPSARGQPAGTGGTGGSGEDILDSESESEAALQLPGMPGRHGGRKGGGHGRGNAGTEQGAENESVAGSSESGLSDQVIDQEPPRQTCYVISPRNSWKIRWDIFCGIWIVYTIIVMTWRIGFDQAAEGGWLVLDYSVDFLFAVDTALCFRTGYFDSQDQLVTDSWEIARKYLLSYFVFDVLSWLPIPLIVEAATGQSSTSMSSSMKLMKFVRLVRLAKLTRLFKLGRFISLLEEKLDLKPAMIRMVKLIANIVFLAHLLACMWHFIALPACGNDDVEVNCAAAEFNLNATSCPLPNCDWIGGSCKALPAIGPCPAVDRYEAANIFQKTNWIRATKTDQETDLVARYITSFYFVIATMMAVGYGDISGTNTEERVFCIILQLFGATSFGFILSSVTSVLESANPRIQEYNKRMHEIKEWMTGRHMPRKLKGAIREHWQYALAKRSIFNEADILGNMPCSMRMDIIQKCYADWLRKLARTFANEDLGLRIELVQLLQPQQVMHREIMLEEGEISYEVYIVLTGCLEALCDGNRKELHVQKNWVTMSLKRSRLGDTLKKIKHLQDEMLDTEGAAAEEVPLEVLCGIYSVSDMVGHAMACPMMVRGFANRTEVLVINKDALADVQSRFPGAIQRDDATEEKLKSAMEEVLKSPLVTHHAFERPVKSLVLLNNVTAPAEELPAALVRGDFNSAPPIGKSLKEMMPNESFVPPPASTDASADTAVDSLSATGNSSRSIRPCMKHSQSTSSIGTGFMSMTSRAFGFEDEDEDPFKKTVVYVFTRRLKEGSDEFEMGEETEDEILNRCIIPPSYRRKLWWDVLVGILIIYSVLVIPLRISFDFEVVVLDFFDIFVDLIFFFDMVLNFRTGYMDSDGYVVTVPHLIRQKYMWTWFPIDFFSTFPVDRCVEAGVGSSSMGKQTRALKMIRMVRLIRLLKLARMLKMGKLAQKFEDMADLSPLALKCINLGGKLTVMSHFLGCFWFFVAAAPEDLENCEPPPAPSGNPDICPWWMGKGIKMDSPTFKLEQYIAAVYWAFTTMTTVGYGEIAGGSPGERVYAIFAMIFGATVFGYIVGSIAAVAGQERGVEALTKKRISLVRNFCEEQAVSDNKVKEVLRHYRFFYQERSPYNEQNLFMELPNRLRKQVTKHVYREALQRIGLFVGPTMKGLETGPLPDWFTSWVMRILEPQAVSMGEIIVNAEDSSIVGEVFFVYDGECEAFLQRSAYRKKEPDKGGHSDTGGSMDSIDEAAPAVGNPTASSGKTKTLMIFSPGTVFGLEHMGSGQSQRYSVRCSKFGHCLLYVLRQSMLAEVQASCPEMVKALQKAIAHLIFMQTKLKVPQKNLELRRQSQNQSQVSAR